MKNSINIVDKGLLSSPVITDEGYLVCDVDFARTGIQQYYNYQFGENAVADKGMLDRVGVYRPEEEVFDTESMASFSLLPLTKDHPFDFLDADNTKFLAVGTSGESVRKNGIYLNTRIKVTDAEVVKEIMENGKKQFSAGYNAVIVPETGVYDGEEYHFVQRKIRGNHIAVAIDNARCGSGCSIKDNDKMKKSILVSIADSGVEIGDALKSEIEKLEKANAEFDARISEESAKVADAEKKADEIQAQFDSFKAEKEKEVSEIQAQLDDAKSQVKSQEQIDGIVTERVKLITDCQSLVADVDTSLSNFDMKKAVVGAKCEDLKDSLDSKSEDYVNARFDVLLNSKRIETFDKDDKKDEHKSELVDSQEARKNRFKN